MSEAEQVQAPDEASDEAPDTEAPEPQEQIEHDDEEAAAEEEATHEAEQVEGVPAEPQALSQRDVEARLKRLDKSSGVWRERVTTIMEEDADVLIPCPLCEPLIPGFVMPSPATPERFPAVREFMGDAQPQEWEQDPNTRTCKTCNGLGMVATGSRVDNQAQLVCTDCGGRGWQGQRAPIPTSGPMAVVPSPDTNGQDVAQVPAIDPPEVAALKAQGYVIIAPAAPAR